MSPANATSVESKNRFPRVSGDEPYSRPILRGFSAFSPRERG